MFCRWHDATYIENTKTQTKQLLELINEFSEAAGYKVNMQKPVAFLYTNNKIPQREIKKNIIYTMASKRTKYWETNLTKEGERAVFGKL